MAIDHSTHDHPATPAARAACRKAMAVNAEGGLSAVQQRMTKEAVVRLVGVEPRGRGRKPVAPRVRREFIRDEGDMADVPHVFSTAIRHAWHQEGWTVRHGNPYNDTEKRIIIDNGHGDELVLVYKAGNHAVNAVFYHPVKDPLDRRRGYRVGEAPVVASGLVMLRDRARIIGSIDKPEVVYP